MIAPRMPRVAILIFGAMLYAVLAWTSLRMAYTQANASAVWPLAGLGIGLLARFGFGLWPIIFVGALTTNLLVNLQNGVNPTPAALGSVAIAIGNAAESLLGALLARRALGRPPEFWAVDGVFRFVFLVALLPPVLSAGGGVLSLVVVGIMPGEMAAEVALTWFTGNVAGILTIAPLFFIGPFRAECWKTTPRKIPEGVLILVFLVFIGQAISGAYFAEMLSMWPKTYMAIPNASPSTAACLSRQW